MLNLKWWTWYGNNIPATCQHVCIVIETTLAFSSKHILEEPLATAQIFGKSAVDSYCSQRMHPYIFALYEPVTACLCTHVNFTYLYTKCVYLYLTQQHGSCRRREVGWHINIYYLPTTIEDFLYFLILANEQMPGRKELNPEETHILTFIMRLQPEGLYQQLSLVRRGWHHHRESLHQLSSDITMTRKCVCGL